MAKARVAINGFGRIGRQFLKAYLEKNPKYEVVAINDLTTPENLAYLLRYDSAYGPYKKKVSHGKSFIKVDGKKFPIYSQRDPKELPWKELNIDIVVESTGIFTTEEKASQHFEAGAKKVVISAPGKGDNVETYLRAVNDKKLKKSSKIVSNASCTTNCVAPVVSAMHGKFGIKKSLLTTIHAVTATQSLVDGPAEDDFRRGRSAMVNLIPTSTGAAKATTKTIPDLKDKFDGVAVRVPIITGSISDIVMLLKKKVSVEEVNNFFRKMNDNPLYKGVMYASDEPLVSTDIIGSPYSAIVDLGMTRVVDGDLVKIMAWYDNEWGYSTRLVEIVEEVALK